MLAKLFDINNGVIIPTEHCYTLKSLKDIMDQYPEEYLKIYQYIFYMTCPNPDLNPFFFTPDIEKVDIILNEIDADFSPEDDSIEAGLRFCQKMFETPTSRAYKGIASMLDRLGRYMETTQITAGRDGNINSLIAAAKNYDAIRASFKGAYKDLLEEQQSKVRGGQGLAYDM